MNPHFSRCKKRFVPWMIFFAGAPGIIFGADSPTPELPPPANVKIDFDRDIRPILENSCLRCHGPQKPHSHFRLDYRVGMLAGGDDNTNDVVPGNSGQSVLIAYVARQVSDMEMPPEESGQPLTPAQIALLRAWIDQGAIWSVTNQTPAFDMVVSPTIREFAVSGNQGKFRELEGTKNGVSEGIDQFAATEQISPDEKVSVEGHALVPEQDLSLKISLDKTDRGFIHAGFDQWRKYYGTDGGFNPTVVPSQFNSDRDLHVDNGRVWADFGLDLPDWPLIVLGYEYQYRSGTESTLDWGFANGKNIFPATQSLDERTHSIKLNISKTIAGWNLENNDRLDFYTEKNEGFEAGIITGGVTPDQFINTKDNYRQIRGTDTLTMDKQIRDWWFLDSGFYYSRLNGSDYFNQSTAIPSFSFSSVLNSDKITLSRESEIFSVANLFTPANGLVFTLGTQNEWTRETGFGESIPDLDLGANVPANSSQDEFKASQSAGMRFTQLPFTSVFGDARFSEDEYGIYQAQDTDDPDNGLERNTSASNLRYDLKLGFDTSPWRWADLVVQGSEHYSDTAYNQLSDVFQGLPGPTNGYPAFILNRTISSGQFETKLVLHPVNWLKTALTYQLTTTQYRSRTDPAYDAALQELVSEGGTIADGRSQLQTYGFSATVTPIRQLFFTAALTYSRSKTTTADNDDPSIVPYEGDIYTVNAAATYAFNPKTSLQVAYNFSYANYAEDNAVAGIPAGLDYTRHDFIIGLSRQITKKLTGAIHYEFSQYREPNTQDANNFTANGIFATLTYQWR